MKEAASRTAVIILIAGALMLAGGCAGDGMVKRSDAGTKNSPTSPTTPPPDSPTTDGGSPPTGSGGTNCAGINACAVKCGDETCFNACLKQGTADAQSKFKALESCESSAAQAACKTQCGSPSTESQCTQCLSQACQSQMTACFGGATPPPPTTPPPTTPPPTTPPPTGGSSCAQIASCFDGCSQTDQNCFDTCLKQGSADGQAKMNALDQCFMNAEQTCKSQCSNPDSQTCYDCEDKACATQLTACFG